MNQIEMKNIKTIKVRGEFIELMEYLEKINIDYADINMFIGFIYIDPKNEFRYKISQVNNNMEIYSFQYIINNNFHEIIPNAIFSPNILYDLDIDLENRTFKKLDSYKPIEPDHIVITIKEDIIKKKSINIIRRLLGC
jgi:hypothetical protein